VAGQNFAGYSCYRRTYWTSCAIRQHYLIGVFNLSHKVVSTNVRLVLFYPVRLFSFSFEVFKQYTGWVKTVSCCTVIDISKARNSPNVKYSIILWMVQDLKVGNNNSICVIKYYMLHTFMTSCLRKLVRVCPAVISLTAFSHRILKHKTIDIKYFTWKYQTMLYFFCSCSYLFTFLPIVSVLLTYSLKIGSLLFWPTLYVWIYIDRIFKSILMMFIGCFYSKN